MTWGDLYTTTLALLAYCLLLLIVGITQRRSLNRELAMFGKRDSRARN